MSEKKITVQCCVPSCRKTNHSEPQILFFPFPKKREMQGRWLHAIRRPELISFLPKDKPFHMFICLEHFKKSDIISVGGRTCLKAGVVPSVFSWKDEETKREVSDTTDHKAKVFGLDKDIVTVTCGGLEAELHKEKFYCPGIHRECILYNNQFITPKMFMIMGDKERLKDWKNAVRIQGVKIRKFIENRQLDFYQHKEFCTGRCVARLPVNLFRTKTQPPDKWVNTSGDISSVKFREKDLLRPDISRQTDSMMEADDIKMEYCVDSDDSIPEEKPNVEILNALLKNPIPKTMTQGSTSGFGITDNQIFWRGVIKLGLMDRCFEVILSHVQTLQTDLILQNVRQQDAHELSAIVREMGLSNKLQHLLASCKQDMDKDCEKLDQQVEELKQKMTDFENRQKILRKRSEEFTEILKLNTSKASTSNSAESSDDSDLEEPEVHFGPIQTSPPRAQRPTTTPTPTPKRSAPSNPDAEETATKKIKISNSSILKVFVKETPPEKKSSSTSCSSSKNDDLLSKIVSISSVAPSEKEKKEEVEEEDGDRSMPTLIRSDGQPMDDVLTSADEKLVDVSNVNSTQMKKMLLVENSVTGKSKQENVRTVLWVKANGTSEYITLSNNSDTKPVDDIESISRKSQSLSAETQSTVPVVIPGQSVRIISETTSTTETPHEEKNTSQSETVIDVSEAGDVQSETVLNDEAGSDSQPEKVLDVKAGCDDQSERVLDVKAGDDSQPEKVLDVRAGGDDQSEKVLDVKAGDNSQPEKVLDVKAGGDNQSERVLDGDGQSEIVSDLQQDCDSQSERLSDVKLCDDNKTECSSTLDKKQEKTKELEFSQSNAKNLSPVKKSPRSVSPLFSNEAFGDFVAARRSSRRRIVKVKEDM